MLVNIIDNKISGVVSISNKEKEQEFIKVNPTYISTDFKFTESLDLYEYDGTTFNLIDGWETIKADREAEAEAKRLAQIEANKPTLEELKTQKIQALQKAFDDDFNRYLSQYPKAEVESFSSKAEEAKAYMLDNTAATPYILAMVGGDETLRVAMINSVWNKVQYRARAEGQMIDKRDIIKNCTTVEELDAIEI